MPLFLTITKFPFVHVAIRSTKYPKAMHLRIPHLPLVNCAVYLGEGGLAG